ncbi:MAG: LysR family transcriptional regulator [Pseudonocardiaceae bacterium]|nr:LysR family transcriptional regulator [Pseudonocardiaceae bacterium]
MTLQQLTYFLAAVRYGSLSAAAEALYMSQPSLSEQIRRLERDLGSVVFIRTNRQLRLTESGHALLPYAERAVALVDEARRAVKEIHELEAGTASFGTFSTAFQFFLADVIEDFHARHPRVRLNVVGLNSQDVADSVRAGDLEAGLIQLPVDDRELHVGTPVMRHEVVYLSTDAERAAQPMTIERLAESHLVLSESRWSTGDPVRRLLRERAQHAGLRIEAHIEVEFQSAALELAARGVADTVVSLPAARRQGYADRLHWTAFEPALFETYAFITRKDVRLSAATEAFIELIGAHLAGLRPEADEGRP